jgi:GTP-binding protein Era
MSDPLSTSTAGRAGIVAIIGRANVGKSSLLNAVLGEKVSIVTPVAQTTRNIIRGILTEPRGQLVFHDTPGVHKAASDLGRVMNRVARTAIEGSDVALLVLDSSFAPRDEDLGWMKRLQREGVPVVIVLNKSDLGGAGAAAHRAAWEAAGKGGPELPAAEASPEAGPPPGDVRVDPGAPTGPRPAAVWHEVSALSGAGVPELVTLLFGLMPEGPLLFPADVLTDFPRKLAMADVVREKLFADLRDELPHAVAVWIEDVREEEGALRVLTHIYVQKYSQKGIIIGEKGRQLRKVRRAAEKELSEIYEKPVTLELWVKVEKKWDRNFWLLKKFGYVP